MTLHKEYHVLENNQEIKFSISFNRDRTNWATSQPKKIGYEANVLPVKRTNEKGYSLEESGAFTGFNDNLLEINRQSAKRLQTAIAVLAKRKVKYLDYFRVSYGLMTREDYNKKH